MSHGDHITRHRGAIRFLLLALGGPQALIGLWALLAPHSFYEDFPAGTDGWVRLLGPFDEHLVTDVGSLFVALGVALAVAALTLRRSAVLAAVAAWLVFSVPHLVWHVFNLEPYGTLDAVANTAALSWTVAGGVLVLVLMRAPRAPALPAHETGARIEGVPDSRAGILARGAYRYSRRELGTVPDPLRVYAHHPTVMAGYSALEYATARADRLPEGLKALAATKAAALAGCEFCMDIGSMISGRAGITEEQLRALPEYAESPLFSEDEKLVLELATGMTATPVDVPDELFGRLRARFDEAQLVELASEIAVENHRGRFNHAFGLGSQGFSAGGFCALPEPGAAGRPAAVS